MSNTKNTTTDEELQQVPESVFDEMLAYRLRAKGWQVVSPTERKLTEQLLMLKKDIYKNIKRRGE